MLDKLNKFSPKNLFTQLKEGLNKTREHLVGRMKNLFSLFKKIDDQFWEELEEILISADVGVTTTEKIIEGLKEKAKRIKEPSELMEALKGDLATILQGKGGALIECAEKPTVVLVVGVNGTGKTTSIAKLAHKLKSEGRKVLLAAADTFRAAAIDQLQIWAGRVGVDLIKHKEGADPAAVCYDALSAAKARDVDYLIIDTAGRLHSKSNLMEELRKVKRVTSREVPGAPHETLLVLDATAGQNAFLQARTFMEMSDVTGIFLAKLDGTAKGGIVIGIADELEIPVKFIGLGERLEDIREFSPQDFLEALFEAPEKS
ncbi:MAG: signal recognition particle-docking protein FtsY [Candidatus Eremiobacteraeota bacterium]|nr:signal recognition particle-docking protein FtsY [Candidatus Eremiobacteraeota bacterium]